MLFCHTDLDFCRRDEGSRGGYTVSFTTEVAKINGGEVVMLHAGLSHCIDTDAFNRKLGREISAKRLTKFLEDGIPSYYAKTITLGRVQRLKDASEEYWQGNVPVFADRDEIIFDCYDIFLALDKGFGRG